jgi:methenyltetrahydromethanopterin cyclohydrolase
VSTSLNLRALSVVGEFEENHVDWRVAYADLPEGGRVVDCGVQQTGSVAAGLALARVCLSDRADVRWVPGLLEGRPWPHIQVTTDAPRTACLFSQYAGWQISVGKYFAMGSGPMRALAAREKLFVETDFKDASDSAVGVLEAGKLPGPDVFAYLAERTGVPARNTTLMVARTASLCGSIQVVARVVETGLHKLHELGFDTGTIDSASGTAPFAPVAKDDLGGIGRTNDSILYGGSIHLWGRFDDEVVAAIGPKVPAGASSMYGQPFLTVFEEAGRDFYKIDPHLFSPAEVTFHNLATGTVRRFGGCDHAILKRSFGLE